MRARIIRALIDRFACIRLLRVIFSVDLQFFGRLARW
jgi:hypothetical protein